MSAVARYFFCASHESIYGLMRRGIWNDMPLNHDLEPISPSTVMILKDDGSEISATDAKLQKYVRLISNPFTYLEQWKGNVASVFIVEVNPRVTRRVDVLKIRRIRDSGIEFLKNIMIDLSDIQRIFVYSKDIEKKLRSAISGEPCKIPIETNPQLFVSDSHNPPEIDEGFVICKSIAAPSDPAPILDKKNLVKICKGDLLLSSMQTHVNTINCVGVMGKGIALSFKNRYPEMFQEYATRCKRKEVALGKPYSYRLKNGRIILNFPTKHHWKEDSRIEEIEKGLRYLVSHAKDWNIQSIALPPLGCGNGNLNWAEVFPLMRKYLSQLEIPVEIYIPHEADSFGQPIHLVNPKSSIKRKSKDQSLDSSAKSSK